MELFYKAKVESISKTTSDCSVVEFEITSNLKDTFTYTQGQYLTIKKVIDGVDIRRSYSLCSSPLDNKWKVAIKQIPGGAFSSYANTQLKAGETVELMKPSGNFHVDINPQIAKNYLAFAAGSGVTPILSIIKTHLSLEPHATFKLFYLNRTAKSIILKDEIEQLKNEFLERFQVFYFLTKEHRDIPFLNGRFDNKKLDFITQNFIDLKHTNDCFICGPKDMIFLISDYFQNAGLPKEKIHYELFFAGVKSNNEQVAKIVERKATDTNVTIIDGGKEFHFVMDEDQETILDSALAAGLDLPFACKGGVCSTCKCKVIEGTVEMILNYALDENEVSQNYVLSCQSVPTSKVVKVDFDV